jgi:asparaginyl-tRNA synthetase
MKPTAIPKNNPHITTGLGRFSKAKFAALVNVRCTALEGLRNALKNSGHNEVTTSSLVNIAGSCENPYASFTLNYYGRDAHLSQSAQLQLEALVIRLKAHVFTVNNSFREENYDDPDASGRRLSEFTLIESERPYKSADPESALKELIDFEELVFKSGIKAVLQRCEFDINALGGDSDYIRSSLHAPFNRIRYEDVLDLLNDTGCKYQYGHDLNISDERKILKHFDNHPTFVTHFPAAIKFFNMKRTPDGLGTYSVDLLTPTLGETSGGAIREENGDAIKEYLLSSTIADYIRENNGDPLEQFGEYIALFDQEPPVLRGGFGIGYERFIGFLIHSNDILNTIAYDGIRA